MDDGIGEEEEEDTYLHLSPAVLEPELDLPGLQPQLPAEVHPLVLVRVRALLEHPAHPRTHTTEDEQEKKMEKSNNSFISGGTYASSC